MLYSIIIIVVLAIMYVIGYVCYNQGEYAGYNDGFKVGYNQANLKDVSTLIDEACIKLFDDIMDDGTCPVCMEVPIVEGQGACNGCLCDLYPDDPRSIYYAAGLPYDDHTVYDDIPF